MTSKTTLSPMLVQYLVALCCLKSNPSAVDVIVGDMVLDPAAGKERDVDVTVTISEKGSITHAFMAYEVKHEKSPLDVTKVEQLCMKLADMPALTHRAIVSSSGFSEGAKSKALHHGVTLYEMTPWNRPLQEQFPELTMHGTIEECFGMMQSSLFWVDAKFQLLAKEAKAPFSLAWNEPLLNVSGAVHPKFPNLAVFQNELTLRSTEILFPLEPAATIRRTFPISRVAPDVVTVESPAWPHTHSLDVFSDEVYFAIEEDICRIDLVTINGLLQWQSSSQASLHYVVTEVGSGEALAGAIVATKPREGEMIAFVFSPSTRAIDIRFVALEEKHLNCIRGLKLERAEVSAENDT